MEIGVYVLLTAVSFAASIAGAVCGIGGGVLIKPVLDVMGVLDVAQVSFLSGCAVLAMSAYAVFSMSAGATARAQRNPGRDGAAGGVKGGCLDMAVSLPLALGAAAGGVCGRKLFSTLTAAFADQNAVGAAQAGCLFLITLGTFAYTVRKKQIVSLNVCGWPPCLFLGLLLGMISAFLGIGGGPINLAALSFFFSMDAKAAAGNSLYIILLSQLASLLSSICSGTVPPVSVGAVVLMAGGGLAGGALGRRLCRNLNSSAVDRLFLCLMAAIMAICVCNMVRFA